MLTWGFIFLVYGIVSGIILLCNNFDLFGRISSMGFAKYVQVFFDPANLTSGKVVAAISFVLLILGIILYLVGRAKNKNTEEGNPVIPVKVKKFFRDTKGEFHKIVWPTLPSVVRNTGVVLAMCAVIGVVIIAIDFVLGASVNWLMSL